LSLLALTGDTLDVRFTGERLEVKTSDGNVHDVPLCELHQAVICGVPHISFQVLFSLLRRQCRVDFMTNSGRWLGALGPPSVPRGERIRQQVYFADQPERKLKYCRALLTAKIKNQRRTLSRLACRRNLLAEVRTPIQHFSSVIKKLSRTEDLETLRGLEGQTAREYFMVFSRFLPESFRFSSRSRNPPQDPANALLSFCYTIAASELEGCIERHGLTSAIGFLHQSSDSFPALAWDILEIFRAPFCDMLCAGLINRGIIRIDHFEKADASGAVFLNQEGRKRFFQAFEKKKKTLFTLPGQKTRTNYASLFDRQIIITLDWLIHGEAEAFFLMP